MQQARCAGRRTSGGENPRGDAPPRASLKPLRGATAACVEAESGRSFARREAGALTRARLPATTGGRSARCAIAAVRLLTMQVEQPFLFRAYAYVRARAWLARCRNVREGAGAGGVSLKSTAPPPVSSSTFLDRSATRAPAYCDGYAVPEPREARPSRSYTRVTTAPCSPSPTPSVVSPPSQVGAAPTAASCTVQRPPFAFSPRHLLVDLSTRTRSRSLLLQSLRRRRGQRAPRRTRRRGRPAADSPVSAVGIGRGRGNAHLRQRQL